MRISLLVLFLWIVPLSAHATLRLGFVNMRKAMSSVDEGKRAQKALLREKARFQKALSKTQKALQRAQKRLKKQSLVMSRKRRARAFARLEKKLRQYQKQRSTLTRRLARHETRLMRLVLAKMQRIIAAVVRENRITVMLDKQANRVLFAPSSMDYTNEVIRRYNRRYKTGRRRSKRRKRRRKRR